MRTWRGLVRLSARRTGSVSRVERAMTLLADRGDDPLFFAVGWGLGVHHQTVQRRTSNDADRDGATAVLVYPPRVPAGNQ